MRQGRVSGRSGGATDAATTALSTPQAEPQSGWELPAPTGGIAGRATRLCTIPQAAEGRRGLGRPAAGLHHMQCPRRRDWRVCAPRFPALSVSGCTTAACRETRALCAAEAASGLGLGAGGR